MVQLLPLCELKIIILYQVWLQFFFPVWDPQTTWVQFLSDLSLFFSYQISSLGPKGVALGLYQPFVSEKEINLTGMVTRLDILCSPNS